MLPSASEIVSKSIDLYKAHYQLFMKYIIYLFIPSAMLVIFSPLLILFSHSITALFADAIPVFLFGFAIAAGIMSLWISLSLIRVTADCYEGRTPKPAKEELKGVARLIWPAIFTSILGGLAVLGGIILLIIPGIIFSVWFAFGTYAVAMDGKRGAEALSWSKNLVKGRWWATLWRLLLPGLILGLGILLAQSIVGLPFGWLQKTAQVSSLVSTVVNIIGGLLATAAGLIVTPLATAAPIILYIELKRNPSSPSLPLPVQPLVPLP